MSSSINEKVLWKRLLKAADKTTLAMLGMCCKKHGQKCGMAGMGDGSYYCCKNCPDRVVKKQITIK